MQVNDVSREMASYALDQVDKPYIFGATADVCTPALRRQLLARNPEYAEKIIKYCPVLSGQADSCAGCNDEGEEAYDCAQLTRFSAEAAGLVLPSGATSQWSKGDWLAKGEIGTLPQGYVAMVYHRKNGSSTTMSHTGIYIGDGTVVDARGHKDGVVHQALKDYPWTHWAILRGMACPEELAAQHDRPTLRQGSRGNSVRDLQRILRDLGYTLEIDGKYGSITRSCVETVQGTHGLTRDGICGPITWALLDSLVTMGSVRYTVTIPGLDAATATHLLECYPAASAQEETTD